MSGWVAIAGTLGGVALGFLGQWWRDRESWRRSDSARWLDERRTLYARFIRDSELVAQAGATVAVSMHLDRGTVPERVVSFGAAQEAMAQSFAELELIAEPEMIDAATRLRDAVQELAGANLGTADSDEARSARSNRLSAAAREWSEARERFTSAARRSLHVP
jgi:hypothetical protein